MQFAHVDTNWNALSDEVFRDRAAALFDQCPQELRNARLRPRAAESRGWYLHLSRAGWLAPVWPRRYGGMELSPSKYLIYVEEMERLGCPRLRDSGVNTLAPILILQGTDAQREEYLPKILAGEHTWCQGYSEPNAGSDLASLRTEAELRGDEFVINGQKLWTSSAFDATHIFMLVRTNKSVKKQAGISFLLVDMRQPGITVRPFKSLNMQEEQCAVFFDNATTPVRNLVGELNNGWNVARAQLGYERLFSGSSRQSMTFLFKLRRIARLTGKLEDPAFVDRLTQITFDVMDLNSAYERMARTLKDGKPLGPEASLLKVWATETCQRVGELMMETADECGGLMGDVQFGDESIELLFPFLEARAWTIYGGANQIQRNIMAKGVLNLPS